MQSPNQSGIALVIVLWVIALLAVIAVSFTTATRGQANLVRNLVENAKAEALADAGLYRAIHGLLSPKSGGLFGPQIENLLTLSSEPAAVRRRIERDLRSKLGQMFQPETEELFVDGWRTDGTVYVWPFGGGRVWVSIQDEDGKIDLNTATLSQLDGLPGIGPVIAERILELREKSGPYKRIEDLMNIRGIGEKKFLKLKDLITVKPLKQASDGNSEIQKSGS